MEVVLRKSKVAPKAKIVMSTNVIQIEIMMRARLLRFFGGGGVYPGGIP